MRTILFSSSGDIPPSASEAKADYTIYKLTDLPQAVDFLAAR
jgi:hypothetical protein